MRPDFVLARRLWVALLALALSVGPGWAAETPGLSGCLLGQAVIGTADPKEHAKQAFEALCTLRKAVDDAGIEGRIADGLIAQMEKAIREGRPIRLYIPCFPAKSPNHEGKTLGPDVDMAEELAVARLRTMVEKMNASWPTELVIASDGRIFAGTWWTGDATVDAYHQQMRAQLKSDKLSLKDINELFHGMTVENVHRLVTAEGNAPRAEKMKEFKKKLAEKKGIAEDKLTTEDIKAYFDAMTPQQARDFLLEYYSPTADQVRDSFDQKKIPADLPEAELAKRIAKAKERLALYQAFSRFIEGDTHPRDSELFYDGTYEGDPASGTKWARVRKRVERDVPGKPGKKQVVDEFEWKEVPRLIKAGGKEVPISGKAKEQLFKDRAIEDMRRSDALNEMLVDRFVKQDQFIRLSIREQSDTPDKIGINLLAGEGQEFTSSPWHSVIGMLPDKSYLVLRKDQAEKLGGKLILQDGKPHHYDLPADAKKKFAEMTAR